MLDKIESFDWDGANVGHILRHAVVFTVRRKLFRTVTAYEMNAADRRNYAPHID